MTHTTTQLIEWLDNQHLALTLSEEISGIKTYPPVILAIRAQLIAAQEITKALAEIYNYSENMISARTCNLIAEALTKATEAGIE